jgi:hypothetical protein
MISKACFIQIFVLKLKVVSELVKLKSIYLCSNSAGQVMTDLMVNPPSKDDCSNETVEKFLKEKEDLYQSKLN